MLFQPNSIVYLPLIGPIGPAGPGGTDSLFAQLTSNTDQTLSGNSAVINITEISQTNSEQNFILANNELTISNVGNYEVTFLITLNNSNENLQVLCPNCHSLTENYKALNKNSDRERITVRKNYCKDCGKEISADALRCRECSNKSRTTIKPLTREELKNKIRNLPFTKIAEEQNVSDNAIRKWCIGYNLPSKKKEINSYSDEEWDLI